MDFVLFLNVINYYITSWDVPKKLRKAKPCAGVYARRAAPLSGVVARAARIPSLKVETYLETLARGLIYYGSFCGQKEKLSPPSTLPRKYFRPSIVF